MKKTSNLSGYGKPRNDDEPLENPVGSYQPQVLLLAPESGEDSAWFKVQRLRGSRLNEFKLESVNR
ncbi:MAG: hypothetical protein HY360_08265 [Verrucomicrobia bacterium]|nr:hypothetical protein [Verrucomicrobiota bacterium]